ncbi:MAG TPA: hypothetical protein VGN63_16510 [Flavisolibacter sp.]|jgi:hypothetical protein|nr:hypothetical protein [Flavisolibacter sp.]
MKKILLLFVIATIFFSCKEASSPKESAQSFIQALYNADITTASDYVSNDSKAVLDKVGGQAKLTQSPEESFRFATLTETVSDKTATVKNEVVSIPLVKEEEGWKVVLTEDLLNEIRAREEMLSSLQTKWGSLLKEYEARTGVARDYIKYKKSIGALSPKAATLSAVLDSAAAPKEWNKESLLSYVQKQQQLNAAIDGALEPSQAANTDLTMNYFLQFSNAGDRIKAAEADYQMLAERAHSPIYVPIPVKAANSLQVKAN